MKKLKFSRIFAVLLALMIVVGTFPLTSLPASAATAHSHPICGSSCRCSSDNHSSYTWTEWDGTTKMYNGNYYLTKDVVLSSTMVLQILTISFGYAKILKKELKLHGFQHKQERLKNLWKLSNNTRSCESPQRHTTHRWRNIRKINNLWKIIKNY